MNAVGCIDDLFRYFVFSHVKPKTISRKDAEIAKKIPLDPLTAVLQKPAPPAEIVAAVKKLFEITAAP